MAWERLAHAVLGSDGDTFDTGTFTAKKNMRIIVWTKGTTGGTYQSLRFNDDTGSNYAHRRSEAGGSDATNINQSFMQTSDSDIANGGGYTVTEITNISDKEKIAITHSVMGSSSGAGTAPDRDEFVSKWANTSAQITKIQVYNQGSGNFVAGSWITVLGAKEAETSDTITVDGGEDLVADYSNDFSSSTGWTLGSGHTISGNKLSGTFTSSGDRSYLDLSSVNISDDSWVLRFGLKITATNTSSVNVLSMGLADSTAVGSATFGAGDDFSAIIYTSDSQKYNMRAVNGGSQVFYERSTSTPVTDTQYYVELKKISDTSATLRFYDNSDYTAGSNALELLSNTGDTSGLTNLDYFMIKPYDTQSGSHTIEISDLKIWNGVSSVRKGFTTKKHLMIQANLIASGSIEAAIRFNNDSGNNYSTRYSVNGSESSGTSKSFIDTNLSAGGNEFVIYDIINEESKEKLVISELNDSNTAGAGTAPQRAEVVGKWTNTSNAITRVDLVNVGTGDFAEGSEVTVYGTD